MITKEQHNKYMREWRKKEKEKNKLIQKKWRDNNKEIKHKGDREYRRNNRDKVLRGQSEYYYKNRERILTEQKPRRNEYNNLILFGGLRNFVLERDNWQCKECGMSQEQHIILFNRSLTIHHKDGNGKNKKREDKNNNIDNLETLCLRCHGRKDRVRTLSVERR